jgi:transcriptional regulator with XRE-family HTH domain
MMTETIERKAQGHDGWKVQRVRVSLGVKQETLAVDLGMSQSEVSKIEQQEKIEDELMSKIAGVLGVSPQVIRDFDIERAIYNINNNYKDATISDGGTAIALQINPIEKIVELYERLLQSEREKIEILKNK